MLIRVRHSIDPRAKIPIPLDLLLKGHRTLRHILALLHRIPLLNLARPLLQRRPLTQVKRERNSSTPNPRIAGNVSDSILRTSQVGTLRETGLEDRIEALGLIHVPLDAVVRACAGGDTEVVGLALIRVSSSSGSYGDWRRARSYLASAQGLPSGT